jgi:hypothetical protein
MLMSAFISAGRAPSAPALLCGYAAAPAPYSFLLPPRRENMAAARSTTVNKFESRKLSTKLLRSFL